LIEADEQAFYRAVEDHYAALSQNRHLIMPADFALLREWWRRGAPLAAVIAGLDEVWARCQEEGEDPVFPLSYCRRAINRNIKRLLAARIGATDEAPTAVDVAAGLAALVERVREAAVRWAPTPAVARLLDDLASAVGSIPGAAAADVVEETLAKVELGALDSLAAALPATDRERLEAEAEAMVAGVDAASEVGRRTRKAVLLRGVRELLRLPRLELGADDR
jgi:hypothetical protein